MKRILLSVLFLPSIALAQLSGKVITVKDGDTIVILDSNNAQHTIRLNGVDCPEKTQDFGQVAKQFVSDVVFGKAVYVEVSGRDRYNRILGKVRAGKVMLNDTLLTSGLAWHYVKYDKSNRLDSLQRIAQQKRLGIWSMDRPIAPWDYRKKKPRN